MLDEKRVFCVDEEDGETEKNDEGIVVVIIRRRATEPLLGFSFRRGRRFEFATHGA